MNVWVYHDILGAQIHSPWANVEVTPLRSLHGALQIRSQQVLCGASLSTWKNQQTAVMQQLPLVHPVCRRNRTITSCHLQRTRWGARKNAQATMWGLLCPPPIFAQHLWRPQIPFIRSAAADPVQLQRWVEDFVWAETHFFWTLHRAHHFVQYKMSRGVIEREFQIMTPKSDSA